MRSDQSEANYRKERQIEDRLTDLNEALRNSQPGPDRERIVNLMDDLRRQKSELERNKPTAPVQTAGAPAEYAFVHGNILLRMNRLGEAEAQYRRALTLKPDYGEAVNNLASLYYQAGKMDSALQLLDEAQQRGLPINAELKQAVMEAKQ